MSPGRAERRMLPRLFLLVFDAQHNEFRGLVAAACHREQRIHAELLHLFALENLDGQSHSAPGLEGAQGELRRSEDVGRFIREGPHEVGGLADHPSAIYCIPEVARARAPVHNGRELLDVAALAVARLVHVGFVIPVEGAFGADPCGIKGICVSPHPERGGAAVRCACAPDQRAGDFSQPRRCEFRFLSSADEKQPSGFDSMGIVAETGPVQLSLEFTGRKCGFQETSGDLVQLLKRRGPGCLVLEDRKA